MVDVVTLALRDPALARLSVALSSRTAFDEMRAGARLAAVAAVFRVVDEPELLFIKRADVERDPWSGHIAFPGGRREESDASLRETAIRETREELDLELDERSMIGRLDDLAPRSQSLPSIIVRPFVAIVRPDVTLVPSREVAATFWVPLSILRDPSSQAYHAMTVNGVRAKFPAYRVDEHLVWGMTHRIVEQLLSLL